MNVFVMFFRFEHGLLSALCVSLETSLNCKFSIVNNIAQNLSKFISKYFNQINVEVCINSM